MAHADDASTFADVLERLGDDGTKDLFRWLLEQALQDLSDFEVHHPDRRWSPRASDARSNYRNGAAPRTLSTPAADEEFADPQGAGGVVLPVAAGTEPPGGQGVVGGDHDRLCDRDLDPEGGRPGPG